MIWTGHNVQEVQAVHPSAVRFRHHGSETLRLVLDGRLFMPGSRLPSAAEGRR